MSWTCTTLALEGRGDAVEVASVWAVGATVSLGEGVEVGPVVPVEVDAKGDAGSGIAACVALALGEGMAVVDGVEPALAVGEGDIIGLDGHGVCIPVGALEEPAAGAVVDGDTVGDCRAVCCTGEQAARWPRPALPATKNSALRNCRRDTALDMRNPQLMHWSSIRKQKATPDASGTRPCPSSVSHSDTTKRGHSQAPPAPVPRCRPPETRNSAQCAPFHR